MFFISCSGGTGADYTLLGNLLAHPCKFLIGYVSWWLHLTPSCFRLLTRVKHFCCPIFFFRHSQCVLVFTNRSREVYDLCLAQTSHLQRPGKTAVEPPPPQTSGTTSLHRPWAPPPPPRRPNTRSRCFLTVSKRRTKSLSSFWGMQRRGCLYQEHVLFC